MDDELEFDELDESGRAADRPGENDQDEGGDLLDVEQIRALLGANEGGPQAVEPTANSFGAPSDMHADAEPANQRERSYTHEELIELRNAEQSGTAVGKRIVQYDSTIESRAEDSVFAYLEMETALLSLLDKQRERDAFWAAGREASLRACY